MASSTFQTVAPHAARPRGGRRRRALPRRGQIKPSTSLRRRCQKQWIEHVRRCKQIGRSERNRTIRLTTASSRRTHTHRGAIHITKVINNCQEAGNTP
eukprot:3870665-Pleurochrysis_carterae.AAC.4